MIRFKLCLYFRGFPDSYYTESYFADPYSEIKEFIKKSAAEVQGHGVPHTRYIFETNDKISINYLLIKYPHYICKV